MTQPPAGARVTLLIHLQGSVLTSNMISPSVTLNGYPVPTSYGANALPVTPGSITVGVRNQWMRVYGQAETTVHVAPGQTVELWYAPPWHQFTTGSIGHEKQRRKGGGAFLALMAVLVAIAVGLVLLAAFA